MTHLTEVLFSVFAGVAAAMFAANVVMLVLKYQHRAGAARRVARLLAPATSYLLLGGKSGRDMRDQWKA